MADATTDRLALVAQTEGVPFIPNDSYRPVHADGRSDLNVHMLDMLDGGDPDSDPFKTPGSIPGEAKPKVTT